MFRCFIMRTSASELIIRTITGRRPPSVSRYSMYCKDVSAVYVYEYFAEVFFENFFWLLTPTKYLNIAIMWVLLVILSEYFLIYMEVQM